MLFFKLFHPLTRGSEYEMIYYHQVDFFHLTQIPQDDDDGDDDYEQQFEQE